MFLLQKNNSSCQVELDSFFEGLGGELPTSSAFTQARSKLSENAFKELNSQSCNIYYRQDEYKKWKGHRVLAVDGSTIQLPNHSTIREDFGVVKFGPKADSEKSIGRISFLYDTLNGLVLDAQLGGFKNSESEFAHMHLDKMSKGDVVLFDRYYASYSLMFKMKAEGKHFCFRMKDNWWKEVEKFAGEKHKEKIVTFRLPGKYHSLKEQYPKISNSIKCRLIKRVNKKGNIQIYCTSLLDKAKYSHKSICNLYKERWNVEEAYKLIKSRLQVEDFSGKKSIAVKQDFHARTLLLTINAILCSKIKKPKRAVKERKIVINKTVGLANLKKVFRKIAQKLTVEDVLNSFYQSMANKVVYSRKGQNNIRHTKPYMKFNMSYKTV